MNVAELQSSVAHFVRAHELEAPVETRLLDLASETGELAKEALAATRYGRVAFQPTAGWAGELADVLFTLICLANTTDVDLEAALAGALNKYQARLQANGDAGSGR